MGNYGRTSSVWPPDDRNVSGTDVPTTEKRGTNLQVQVLRKGTPQRPESVGGTQVESSLHRVVHPTSDPSVPSEEVTEVGKSYVVTVGRSCDWDPPVLLLGVSSGRVTRGSHLTGRPQRRSVRTSQELFLGPFPLPIPTRRWFVTHKELFLSHVLRRSLG